MSLLSDIRKKVRGIETYNEINPRPSVALTTVVDNPRFKEASIDTSRTPPRIKGTFSIDVTNTGVLPTRGTRITNAEITIVKDESSITIVTIEEPKSIGSISGGSTETIDIKFNREGDFLRNVTQEVCTDANVETDITFTISELLLAAQYQNKLEVPVKDSNCTTITLQIIGQSDINIGQEYSWELNKIGEGDIGNITWSMGDGTTYTGTAVNHEYSDTGEYDITVDTEQGYSVSKSVNVSVVPFGIAGPVDVIVDNENTWQATGENLSQVNEITWSFGDGETETKQSNTVSHIYKNAGEYTLNATSDTGYNAELEVDASVPDVTVNRISSPDSVSSQSDFDASVVGDNLGDADSIRWDMGDGTILNGQSVSHRYATSGTYQITVEAIFNDESISSASTEISVEQFVL